MRNFNVNGTNYRFEVWTDGNLDVLVAFYTQNGETFGKWTSSCDELPASAEEAAEWLDDLDWEDENMTYLHTHGFAPKNS